MKLERDTELTMLETVVLPKIQQAKECLRAGKTEEMWKIISHDLIGLFQPYRDSEMKKYNDEPDNLKESPNVERMLNNAEAYQKAIDLLWDGKENAPRSVDEETLSAVENIVEGIIGKRR
ncbi:MAG: hypothetical protein NC092_03915 [Butyrivibrio sp.]|nr:hypothetical protein [Muribaculum sp.]MCM1551820.1 hypothetical protein [Butyrivibrio sp.]